MINSCKSKNPSPAVTLIKVANLESFSSASALEYHQNKIFVFGDDVPYLLVLDTNYNTIQKIPFLSDTSYRIDKEDKQDIESAVIINSDNGSYLFGFGSSSTESRKNVFRFSLDALERFTKTPFTDISASQIKEWNIEGTAFANDNLVLVNRANNTQRINHLIFDDFYLSENDDSRNIKIVELELPQKDVVIGVSGLFYVKEKDMLLFTASEEDTENSYEDGEIGDSYLGVILNFSNKNVQSYKPDHLIKLSEQDQRFRKQKVESICVQEIRDNELIVHLAVDNDNGKSTLFKASLRL